MAWVGFVETYPLILLGESLKSEHTPLRIVFEKKPGRLRQMVMDRLFKKMRIVAKISVEGFNMVSDVVFYLLKKMRKVAKISTEGRHGIRTQAIS